MMGTNAPTPKPMPTGTKPTNGSAPLWHHRSATATTIACPWTVCFLTLPPFSTPHPFTPHPHGVPQAPRSILTPTLPPPLHPGNHFNGIPKTGHRALTPNPQLGDQGATRDLPHQPLATPSQITTCTCNPTRSPRPLSKGGQQSTPLHPFAIPSIHGMRRGQGACGKSRARPRCLLTLPHNIVSGRRRWRGVR
jgi:hypothetical protein